jgi:fatty acid desaturase
MCPTEARGIIKGLNGSELLPALLLPPVTLSGRYHRRRTLQTTMVAGTASDYRALAGRVRDAGLLTRQPVSYTFRMVLAVAALTAGWVALFIVGDSWACLGIAGLLAFLFTQADFVGHDAGHQQIFRARWANQLVGLFFGNLLTGLSFGWWVPKHNAHHAHPNVVGQDPDVGAGVVALSFTAAIAQSRHGAGRTLARYQAWLFFPLLLLEGAGLHISVVDSVVRRRDRAAAVEALLLGVHAVAYLSAVFWVLSPVHAIIFIVVQQGVFGLYLGCSFAPNHKGMPVLCDDSDLGFVRRQVAASRNVAGGPVTSFIFGGLNYQIEHHLFPAMPRANLRRARGIVRAFCDERGIVYNEDSLIGSYRQALRYLSLVGAAATLRGGISPG